MTLKAVLMTKIYTLLPNPDVKVFNLLILFAPPGGKKRSFANCSKNIFPHACKSQMEF